MKIFGKTTDGYAVHLTQKEIDIIIFGDDRPSYSKEKFPNYKEVTDKLEKGLCEVEICKKFEKIMRIAHDSDFKDKTAYDSVAQKLQNAIKNLKAYETLIADVDQLTKD